MLTWIWSNKFSCASIFWAISSQMWSYLVISFLKRSSWDPVLAINFGRISSCNQKERKIRCLTYLCRPIPLSPSRRLPILIGINHSNLVTNMYMYKSQLAHLHFSSFNIFHLSVISSINYFLLCCNVGARSDSITMMCQRKILNSFPISSLLENK